MNMLYDINGGIFWVGNNGDYWAIYRWGSLAEKPGTYRAIMPRYLSELLDWPTHPTCVVDDFGNLVRVPS